MPNLASIKFNNLYCLFKGEPGLRKSGAALSFPKPIYYFNWDRKMDALLVPAHKWGIDLEKDVQFDDYYDWNAGKAKLEKLQVNCPFKTIVIDSITSCADAINRQTLKIKGADDKGKGIAGIPVNSIEDFNAEESALKELVALTKDIAQHHKVNIILIAHVIQKDHKNPAGQITHVSRTLVTAGKGIAQKIPAYCGEIYHFNIQKGNLQSGGESKYTILTKHTGEDFARTSLILPEVIEMKDDEPLYDKWILPAINEMNAKNPTLNQSTITEVKKFGA